MAKHPAAANDDAPPKAKRRRKRKAAPTAVKARRARARRATAPRSNPAGGGFVDDLKQVGAGLGAYAGTRLVQRVAMKVVSTRKPAWTKHVTAASGAAVFAAALFAAKRVKQIAAYETSIVLGAGVAAAQGIVSSYIPRYAWLMNDAAGALIGGQAPAPAALPQAASGDPMDYLEHELQQMEQQQALPRARRAPVKQALRTAAAATGDTGLEEALVAELDGEEVDDLYRGAFADPTLLAS